MAGSINEVECDFKKVLQSRRRFLERSGIDMNKTVCMGVTHGFDIVEADPKLAGVSTLDYHKAIKVDGLMTDKKDLYLFLLIADCLPMIIYDPVRRAVALVHAGWKGVDGNIAGKAIEKFMFKFKSKAEDIIVGIGPCARKESFIKENPEQSNDLRWKDFIVHVGDDKYQIDLAGFTTKQLIEGGVGKENIIDCYIDTVRDNRFFSYVREKNLPFGQQGRFACVIGLI